MNDSTLPPRVAEFDETLALQKAAHLEAMSPSLAARRDSLQRLYRLITENEDALVAAINSDYGHRAEFETRFAEAFLLRHEIKSTLKQLRRWMRPEKRHLSFLQYPFARAWTFPQPKGVVGIIVPWNFPLLLSMGPVTTALAAGNRVMVKMSENSNHLASLLREIVPKYFDASELAVFEDGGGRGPSFSALAFDHLFFTGSSSTGRAVMMNAARNLTPVTLELGGKSPAVIGDDYDIAEAAKRVMWAKTLNAGQICTNVDHLYVPENKVDSFVAAARAWMAEHVSDINSGDYTAVIDQVSYDRLQATLADAVAKGATRVDLLPGEAGDAARRIMAPVVLLNVTDDMEVMQREIFGPLLPIIPYRSVGDVIVDINSKPRPLAMYVYSHDRSLQEKFLHNTLTGGVGLNEAVVQAGIHSLPFGGTGNSGMGHYHGIEGFHTFSKLRPVFKQSRVFRGLDLFLPPYEGLPRRLLSLLGKLQG